MGTTSLMVEILIIGFQVIIWFSLILLNVLGIKSEIFVLIEENQGISLILATVIIYIIGLIFDSLISKTFSLLKQDHPLYHSTNKKNVIDILCKFPEIHKFLDNLYGRYRIVRATLFNIPLITINGCITIFLSRERIENYILILLFIFFLGVTLTLLTYIAWKARKKSYGGYLERAYELVNENKIE